MLGRLQVAGRGHRPAGRATSSSVWERTWYVNGKGYYEFAAKNRPDGWNVWLSLLIPLRPRQEVRLRRGPGGFTRRRDQGRRETQNDGRKRDGAGRGPRRPRHGPSQGPPGPITRRAALGGLIALAWEARALAQTPPAPAPPGGGSPTMSAADRAGDQGPAERVGLASSGDQVGGDDDRVLPPAARFLGRPPTGGAQRGQHPGLGEDAAGVRRRRLRGRHAGGQGRAPGDPRERPDREGDVPVGEESGGGLPEASPAEHPPQGPHARAGPPGDGAVDGRAEGEGRVQAAQERSAEDRVLDDAGHPRPDRRRAEVRTGRGKYLHADHEHASPPAEGAVGGALPPALRRLADRARLHGAVDGGPHGAGRRARQADAEPVEDAIHRPPRLRGPEGPEEPADPREGSGPGDRGGDRAHRAHRDPGGAELLAHRRHPAPLRLEHDRPRVQAPRRPADLRPGRGPLVPRRHPRGPVDVRARHGLAAGLREDPRREPEGEREGVGARHTAGRGGRDRQQPARDGGDQDQRGEASHAEVRRRRRSSSRSRARRSSTS